MVGAVIGKLGSSGGGGWLREREYKKQSLDREVRYIFILFLFYCLYYFNVLYEKIKVKMLDML